MIDILNMKDDIIKFLFWMNIITLIVGIFLSSKAFFITMISINIVFNGTFMVISKFSHVFDTKNKMFGPLGNLLDMANNMGRK